MDAEQQPAPSPRCFFRACFTRLQQTGGKMIRVLAQASVALCCLLPLAASAQVYKWVDEQGRPHYGDRPPASAKTRPVTAPINTFEGTPVLTAAKPSSSAASGRRAEQVTIYTTTQCGYCIRAKQHMEKIGVPYVEQNVETSASARAEYGKLGARGVPVIISGTSRLDGYSAERLEALLKAAGY